MTVLFVYPTPFCPLMGGVERVTDSLAKEFLRRGLKVLYLHNSPGSASKDYKYPAPVYFFPDRNYNSQANHRFYREFLNEKKVDIIINHCGAFGDSALYNNTSGSRAKVISMIHMNPMMDYPRLWHSIYPLRNQTSVEKLKRIARCVLFPKLKRDYRNRLRNHYVWLQQHTDKICLLSPYFKDELKSILGNVYNENIVTAINNPTDFPPTPYSETRRKRILWVGRFDLMQKRPDRAVQLWRRIYKDFPDWELVMIGDGDIRESLEKKASDLERVSFTGYTDPAPYYRDAELLLLTSNFEGWGMVLVEAMANGVVPITFDSFASCQEIITDVQCRVSPFDISEYESKLRTLLRDPGLRANLRKQNYNHTSRFSVDKTAEKWIDLFQNLQSVQR